MLTTASQQLADRVERLRLHGIERDAWRRYARGGDWSYDVTEIGFKMNMTDFQAALGLSQLRREPVIRARREAIATRYSAAFAGLGDLVELPVVEEGVRPAWHLYPLRLAGPVRWRRDQLIEDLGRLGIGASVHFKPLHLNTYLRERLGFHPASYPVCEDTSSRVLSLPLYPGMSESDVDRVIDAVTTLVGGYAC